MLLLLMGGGGGLFCVMHTCLWSEIWLYLELGLLLGTNMEVEATKAAAEGGWVVT